MSKGLRIILHSCTRAEFTRSQWWRMRTGLHLLPEYIVSDSAWLRRLRAVARKQKYSAFCLGYGTRRSNEVVWLSRCTQWRRYKAVGFADEIAVPNAKPPARWIRRFMGVRCLPLVCYELYFPHFAAYFAKRVDLVLWMGTLRPTQFGWFRKLVKVRAADFGCVVAGVTYPLRTPPSDRISFCVFPTHSVKNDKWFRGRSAEVVIPPAVLRAPLCSHGHQAEELFAKQLYGPFVGDINAGMFTRRLSPEWCSL